MTSDSKAYTSPFYVLDLEQFKKELQDSPNVQVEEIGEEEIRLKSLTGKWDDALEVIDIVQESLAEPDDLVKFNQIEENEDSTYSIKTAGVNPDEVYVIDSPDFAIGDLLHGDDLNDFFSDDPYGEAEISTTEPYIDEKELGLEDMPFSEEDLERIRKGHADILNDLDDYNEDDDEAPSEDE